MVKVSNSPEETISLGVKLSRLLKKGDVVSLEGNLGGGKTTFVKGVLEGFGYKEDVLSPSFTLVHRYEIKEIDIYHIDLYRTDGRELFSFGIEDYLYNQQAICLIEWGQKIETIFTDYIRIEFIFLEEYRRKIIFSDKNGKNRNLIL